MSTDSRIVRQIAAVAIGNALEWYDFGIYGYVAVTISKLFFPPDMGWAPLLETFGLFAVAYVVRPIGGLALGYYADRFGRKTQLVLSIGLMTIASAMITVAPTYRTAGVLAPLVILAARLLQGLSAGGVFGSATAFLVEQAPPRGRGFYGAWQFSGQGAAILLSGVVGLVITRDLSSAQLESWGWRLPFAIGMVLGPLGMYIRSRLSETPEFLKAQMHGDAQAPSIVTALTQSRHNVLVGLGLVLGGTAAFYVLFVFMPTYGVDVLRLGLAASFVAPVAAGATIALFCPVMGAVSDRVGYRPVMAAAAALALVIVYPAFSWLQIMPTTGSLIVLEIAFGILFAAYAGPGGAAMAGLYPVRSRATALAVTYNVGVALFGGGAPIIVTWLIARTGDRLSPAYYVMVGLSFSLIALAAMPRFTSAHDHPSGVGPGSLLGTSED